LKVIDEEKTEVVAYFHTKKIKIIIKNYESIFVKS